MIRLVEYEPTTVRLDPIDAEYLLALVKSSSARAGSDEDQFGREGEPALIESLTPTSVAGTVVVRTGPYVGRMGLPSGQCLDLVSRFGHLDTVELVRRISRLPIRSDTLRAPAHRGWSLPEAIAIAYVRDLERVVSAGLAKGYVARRYVRPPYPGTIDVGEHLRRCGGRPEALVTTARSLTVDIEQNQVARVALDLLGRLPLAADVARRVSRAATALRAVSSVQGALPMISRLPMSTLSRQYQDLLGLAEVILRSQSLVHVGQDLSGASLVFSMPKIWEAYVWSWVRDRHPSEIEVKHGHPFALGANGSLPAEADVVTISDGAVIELFDAKYKRMKASPARPDVYQMVTYCEHLGVDEASLVYPTAEPALRTFQIGNRRLHQVGLPGPTPAGDETRDGGSVLAGSLNR